MESQCSKAITNFICIQNQFKFLLNIFVFFNTLQHIYIYIAQIYTVKMHHTK
jgi:hypothetical protein